MSRNSRDTSLPDVGVLLAAAGKGERAGGEPKQFRPIAGVPMLLRALRPFAQHPRVGQIVVALPPGVAATPPEWLVSVAGERLQLVEGGKTRAGSVRAALRALSEECRIVLIHDAARPFVRHETVEAVIQAVGENAVVPGVPVSDTLKQADPGTGLVVQTIDRANLWKAQTPQGFTRSMLEQAYHSVNSEDIAAFTDEAALVEAAGFTVRLVPDSGQNLKVTTADDFAIAEVLARR
jgi:2-C-methyl-D-erythritol 4-phosphate cytidylyltransferase